MSRGKNLTIEAEQAEKTRTYLIGKRKMSKVTQDDVAYNACVSRKTISGVENGRSMDIKVFFAYCNTTGIKPSDLLKEIGL